MFSLGTNNGFSQREIIVSFFILFQLIVYITFDIQRTVSYLSFSPLNYSEIIITILGTSDGMAPLMNPSVTQSKIDPTNPNQAIINGAKAINQHLKILTKQNQYEFEFPVEDNIFIIDFIIKCWLIAFAPFIIAWFGLFGSIFDWVTEGFVRGAIPSDVPKIVIIISE